MDECRDKKGRFAAGNKGGGRPRMPDEFKELARRNSTKALEVAVAIMFDPDAKHSDRIRAAEIVMDRAWGRPIQGVELTGEDGGPLKIVLEGPLDKWAR